MCIKSIPLFRNIERGWNLAPPGIEYSVVLRVLNVIVFYNFFFTFRLLHTKKYCHWRMTLGILRIDVKHFLVLCRVQDKRSFLSIGRLFALSVCRFVYLHHPLCIVFLWTVLNLFWVSLTITRIPIKTILTSWGSCYCYCQMPSSPSLLCSSKPHLLSI